MRDDCSRAVEIGPGLAALREGLKVPTTGDGARIGEFAKEDAVVFLFGSV